MKQFVNRKKELETLRKEYSRKEASFVVIYGRRRVGKTALIKEFCKDKRSIMFLTFNKAILNICIIQDGFFCLNSLMR